MASTDMHFSPLMNGIDYLESVVQHLGGDGTDRELKYGVPHLQAAVEVLLKRRLQTEHWALVVKDTAKADRDRFDAGDFQSITVDETVRRLRAIVGVPVADDDVKAVKRLAEFRNQLQHWGLRASAEAVKVLSAQVLDFLIRFIEGHLQDEFRLEAAEGPLDRLEEVREGLNGIKVFIEQRLRRVNAEIVDEELQAVTVQCPKCEQLALVVCEGAGVCRFCSNGFSADELADQYVVNILRFSWRDVADGDASPLTVCPWCECETLVAGVLTVAVPQVPESFCLACATPVEGTAGCFRCGAVFVPRDEESVCDNCFSIAWSKN